MSLYSERLAHLKKELSQEIAKRKKKKKKFTHNQQIMIDFINGAKKEARFIIKEMDVVLKKGDDKKGFIHILQEHYCKGCKGELTMLDLLNFDLYLSRAIKLNEDGVSNNSLDVYKYIKGLQQYKIVLKKEEESLVVTFYSVG